MMFQLHYWVSDNGDGSASVRFTETLEEAQTACALQSEGWAESSAASVELKIEDGRLFVQVFDFSTYAYIWKPVQEKAT